jgi:hypothetical protein
MKFDKTKLKVGDTFYGVDLTNNAFRRDKIHQVIDGKDWFHYTMPLREYKLQTYEVLGIVKPTLEGKWSEGLGDLDYLENHYFVSQMNSSGVQSYVTDLYEDIRGDHFFVDKADALEYIEVMEKEAREMDKK